MGFDCFRNTTAWLQNLEEFVCGKIARGACGKEALAIGGIPHTPTRDVIDLWCWSPRPRSSITCLHRRS